MNDFKGIAVNATDDQLLQAGQERLAYNIFFRTMHCWKIGDVSATKFKEAPPKIQLHILAKLKIPHGLGNPAGFNAERWLLGQGITATGTVSRAAFIYQADHSWRDRWLA
jgi:predicted membrane metal-binding protein